MDIQDEESGLLGSGGSRPGSQVFGSSKVRARESINGISRERQTANKRDIGLMIFINFLSFICFAIVLPSLWPFLKSMGAGESMIGWAVAINSFGTFVASPFLGKWADKGGVKIVIFASLVLMIIGNVMYALSPNTWVLLGARFIVGISAANYAPASAYLAYATHPKDRNIVMALNSAASVLGFILGPALGAALASLDLGFNMGKFHIPITGLTAPGWVSVLLSLVCIVFLPTFRDLPAIPEEQVTSDEPIEPAQQGSARYIVEKNQLSGPLVSASASRDSFKSLKVLATTPASKTRTLPYVSIAICLFLQFAFYTGFTVFETIGTPYAEAAFGWDVTLTGVLFAGIGVECILALIILQLFAMVFRDRTLLLGCEVIMVIGFAILISYPFKDHVDLPRFLIGVSLASSAFSAACALLISIFSKVLGNVEQGLLMGWLSSSGSIARTIGPLAAGYLLEYCGGGVVFMIVSALMLLSVVATLAYWTTLLTKGVADYKEEALKKQLFDKKRESSRPKVRSSLATTSGVGDFSTGTNGE